MKKQHGSSTFNDLNVTSPFFLIRKETIRTLFSSNLLSISKICLPLQRQNKTNLTIFWWIRLTVRTHASHACNTSSILVSTTKALNLLVESFFYLLSLPHNIVNLLLYAFYHEKQKDCLSNRSYRYNGPCRLGRVVQAARSF